MTPELSQEETEKLLSIREKYRIDPERFRNGYAFAQLILEGQTRVEAYMIAFNVNRIKATQNATRLYASGWIQAIIKESELDYTIQQREDTEAIREEMKNIMIDGNEETKDRIAAARVLESMSKRKDNKLEVAEAEQTTAVAILSTLKELTSNTKMISQQGELIDVPILE